MKLKKVTVHKYKSFLTEQEIDIEDSLTCIVGKNESGKTAFLEALSKFNYFDDKDDKFEFNKTLDYPRNELKEYEKQYPDNDFKVIKCEFELSEKLIQEIENDIGKNILSKKVITIEKNYNGAMLYCLSSNTNQFIKNFIEKNNIEEYDEGEKSINFSECSTLEELHDSLLKIGEYKTFADNLQNNFMKNEYSNWNNKLNAHIISKWIKPNLPKFWYFDEYYTLVGRVNLTHYKNKTLSDSFTEEQYQITSALFGLSGVDIEKFMANGDNESFIAELEATSNSITDKFQEYWSTNDNLEIRFFISTEPKSADKILEIRIYNTKHRVTLPLKNRSKGFIWFFSFLVWFNKIQNKKNIIILLDEPGLNLHADAQEDLIKYINKELIPSYQTIYTTHSPFMIDASALHSVRTIYDSGDAKKGAIISDALEEKDKHTLFPLQAALGYNIAQNLYIATNNLLVEGVSDLVYLTIISEKLKSLGKAYLNDDITIVPTGGLDKVATFISLLRGNKLKIGCLLDTFTSQKGKNKIEDLIKDKIIKETNIVFIDEFIENLSNAEFEDIFEISEYVELFNLSFENYKVENLKDIKNNYSIVPQINKIISVHRFNHYTPANYLSKWNGNPF